MATPTPDPTGTALLAAFVSAVVAAIIALLIDFTVKPHLETRSERIREQSHAKERLRRQLSLLSDVLSDVWGGDMAENPGRALVEKPEQDLEELAIRLEHRRDLINKLVAVCGPSLAHVTGVVADTVELTGTVVTRLRRLASTPESAQADNPNHVCRLADIACRRAYLAIQALDVARQGREERSEMEMRLRAYSWDRYESVESQIRNHRWDWEEDS